MKLLFLCYANERTGLGHFVRSRLLAETAKARGHEVVFVGDRNPAIRGVKFWMSSEVEQRVGLIFTAPFDFKPDWLVVDMPDPPFSVFNLVHKTCIIDGVGHSRSGNLADLIISQGLDHGRDGYGAPEYLILRPELFEQERQPKEHWLVWGGAEDELGMSNLYPEAYPTPKTFWLAPGADSPFGALSKAKVLVAQMGMMVWEAVAIGVPTYVFSLTDAHLTEARRLEDRGWVRAFPRTGLPSMSRLQEFLPAEPFVPAEADFPTDGAERVIGLLEDNG